MTFIDAVRACFVKYADFTGCATREEFWWFMLFLGVGSLALEAVSENLSFAFTLATMLPCAAVTTRRLHDTDRSGWLQLLVLIPLVGWIVLIVFCAQQSVRPNRYADDAAA